MRARFGLLLCLVSTSCVSYSSIQKTDQNIYLSGAVNYFVISVPFLKRCDVDGQVLHCEELKEFEPPSPRRSNNDGAPAADGGAPAAPAAPAPAPEKKAPPK